MGGHGEIESLTIPQRWPFHTKYAAQLCPLVLTLPSHGPLTVCLYNNDFKIDNNNDDAHNYNDETIISCNNNTNLINNYGDGDDIMMMMRVPCDTIVRVSLIMIINV
jgi:hypothetical protein